MEKVLAVQLPASCPLQCAFCRTPAHGEGNMEHVQKAIEKILSDKGYKIAEVYLTSNGETGFAEGYESLVVSLQERGYGVSVLCATEKSIIPGLRRVEISHNEYTTKAANKAVEKAKILNIPFVVSRVDTGEPGFDPESAAQAFEADGVLIRALQKEGLSHEEAGRSRFLSYPGKDLGKFPVAAYKETAPFGFSAICIDHNGNLVPFLGSPVIN